MQRRRNRVSFCLIRYSLDLFHIKSSNLYNHYRSSWSYSHDSWSFYLSRKHCINWLGNFYSHTFSNIILYCVSKRCSKQFNISCDDNHSCCKFFRWIYFRLLSKSWCSLHGIMDRRVNSPYIKQYRLLSY